MPVHRIHRKAVPTCASSSSDNKHDGSADCASGNSEHKNGALAQGESKGKGREDPSIFAVLPKEIIQQILFAADPCTFDALTLVNSRWYHASRSIRLYVHQLVRCGVDNPVADFGHALPGLVQAFALSARRELFETMLNPTVVEIQLIYSASCSAAAAPGGEAFRFRFSPTGTTLLALSSSRIFVIDLSEPKPVVQRELKVSKRPSAAAILDDGSILAVLNANHNVALYDLRGPMVKLMRSFPLENEPRTIALSPGAEVLGAAYDGGIEVYSLLEGSGPTDRRSVNCDTVDSLEFSLDGTALLGTAMNSKSPTTVLVSAQHFSIDMPVEGLAQLWTTQVLFPRSSRDSSHASLLPASNDDEVAWTFAYDRVYQTFRAVRVEDLRNGHTYFTGPNDEEAGVIPPSTLPTSARDGSLVAAGFLGGRIWLYGVPEKLDRPSVTTSDDAASITTCSTPERTPSNASRVVVPQWQVLSERLRNIFVRGRELSQIPGLLGMRFVQNRLVAVAGGGVSVYDEAEERSVAAGGGRIVIFDFSSSRRPNNIQGSKHETVVIEIGDGIQGPVEALQEINPTLEIEIDLARRRTVRRIGPTPPIPPSRRHLPVEVRPSTPPEEDPYTHNAPRSATTLQRAATVARPADPARYARVVGPDGRPLPLNHRERIIGLQTQESWEPPPPPYSARNDNPVPLPPHVLQTLQPPPVPPVPPVPQISPQRLQSPQQVPMQRARSTLGSLIRPWVAPIDTTLTREGVAAPIVHSLVRRGSVPLSDHTEREETRPLQTAPLSGPSIAVPAVPPPSNQTQWPSLAIRSSSVDDLSLERPAAPPTPRFPINRISSQTMGAFAMRNSPVDRALMDQARRASIESPTLAIGNRSRSLPLEHYGPAQRPQAVLQPSQLVIPTQPHAFSSASLPEGTQPAGRRIVNRATSVRRRVSRAEISSAVSSSDRRRRRRVVGVRSSSSLDGEVKGKTICLIM